MLTTIIKTTTESVHTIYNSPRH